MLGNAYFLVEEQHSIIRNGITFETFPRLSVNQTILDEQQFRIPFLTTNEAT